MIDQSDVDPPPSRNSSDEALAAGALGWLAADDERLSRFLSLAGIDPGDVRQAAREPSFLVAVLEAACATDEDAIACARALGVAPERLTEARQRLEAGAAAPASSRPPDLVPRYVKRR